MIQISRPSIESKDGWSRLVHRLSGVGLRGGDRLEFAVRDADAAMLSPLSDAAMLGLLVPAMQVGADLALEGEVSADLLGNLNGPVQEILRLVLPDLRPIRIHAHAAQPTAGSTGARRLMGFSAGGDSLYSLLRPRQAGDLPPTHLVNANVGGHGEGDAADAVFASRVRRLRGAAGVLGLPLVEVDSNLRRFHDRRSNFVATVIPRTAAAMHAIGHGAQGYEFANAYHRSRQETEIIGDVSRVEDRLLPLLSAAGLRMRSSGSDATRVEKMLLVTDNPVTEGILDVCMEPRKARGFINCGRCLKCQRALLFLDICGRTERFGRVFDLRLHRRLRWWTEAFFLQGSPDMRRELEALAEARGYRFGTAGRLMSKPFLLPIGKLAQRLVAVAP